MKPLIAEGTREAGPLHCPVKIQGSGLVAVMGSLSPRGGFSSTLLLAWAAGQGEPNVAAAVQLPGAQPGQKSLTILDPLKLDIARIFLLLQEGDDGGYLVRFQNVALSFLGVRFPPGGQANATLFGNPDPGAATSALGWYAAYRKDPGPSGPTGASGAKGPSGPALGAAPALALASGPGPAGLLPADSDSDPGTQSPT